MLDFGPAPVLLEPALVWGLVARGLGLLFVFAHASLLPQIVGLAGARGVSPIAPRLVAVKAAFPGLRRFVEFPTLLWLNASDSALRAMCVLGILGGAFALVGGPLAPVGLGVAWFCYLSLDQGGLSFPWDMLLMEAGFLGLFLPALPLLPVVAAASAPSPLVAFLFMWLAARLMLGFAKVKFIGTKKGDDLYLKTFFIWMPMPHPLGWLAHHLPDAFHRLSLWFMFVAEVVAPLLVLVPGWPRLIGAALLVALMLGIQATGNWGFFNLGYIVLCVAFLDVTTSPMLLFHDPLALVSTPSQAVQSVGLLMLFGVSVFQLVLFNTWVARTWMNWPLFDRLGRRSLLIRAVLGFWRWMIPLRVANAYGVFPAQSSPAVRHTPVFEGSRDGETWVPYPTRYLPTDERQRPPVVAPHHARFDQGLPYTAGGISDTALFGSIVGSGNPVSTYLRYGGLERACQRLLAGEPAVLRLFARDPFEGEPPRYVRVSNYAMVATSLAEHRASGRWWKRRRVGAYVLATEKNDDVLRRYMSEPELLHPDLLWHRRRATTFRAIERALLERGVESAVALDDAVLASPAGLTAADLELFWERFVPFARAKADDWDGLGSRAEALLDELGADGVHRVERVLERAAWVLRHRLEPHREGRAEPEMDRMTNFAFHLSLHRALLEGKDAFVAWCQDPSPLVERFRSYSQRDQLYVVGLLRYDVLEFAARTFRWMPISGLLAGDNLPSAFAYRDVLASITPRDEEWVPQYVRTERGAWSVVGLDDG